MEAHFGAFECIAAALRWPEEVLTILLQCKLTGRAQEACSSSTPVHPPRTEKVKSVILLAYELVPEAYSLRKAPSQTYIDFAREKGILFDR